MPFQPMNFERMNEADIRGEILDPLLRRLGYQSGTQFNIVRERTLRYPQKQLGRRKRSDPPITGRPDYILEIRGIDRWIVEAKSPASDITADDVYQAFSYAFLPEIAAGFFVLSNGRRLQAYKTVNGPDVAPVLDLAYEDLEASFQTLSNILGPESFKRALIALKIDTGKPLAPGLPSAMRIVGGYYEYAVSRTNLPILQSRMNKVVGVRLPVDRGFVRRVENRIAVEISQGFIHQLQESTSRAVGVGEGAYLSADEEFSRDPDRPNIFEGTTVTHIPRGQMMFSFVDQIQMPTPVAADISGYTEAVGHLVGNDLFTGRFYGAADLKFQAENSAPIMIEVEGPFQIRVAPD
jgi:hypothetical protein